MVQLNKLTNTQHNKLTREHYADAVRKARAVPGNAQQGFQNGNSGRMLTIREAQFAVLSQVEVEKFQEWILAHLKKFFPQQCAAAGNQQLQEMVQYEIKRAAVYGFSAKRDVCKYIDLMIVFGRDFDTDRRSRWAGEILSRRRNPGVKMQILLQAAKLRLRNR